MIFNLSEQNSIANQFLLELRDKKFNRIEHVFRKNMERFGKIMAALDEKLNQHFYIFRSGDMQEV